jgi:hypothetical protein
MFGLPQLTHPDSCPVYQGKGSGRWQIDAITEAEKGVSVIDSGGGLIKKRVSRSGQGKSGVYRTIIVCRVKTLAIFVYGFPKSTKANLNALELDAYKKIGSGVSRLQ